MIQAFFKNQRIFNGPFLLIKLNNGNTSCLHYRLNHIIVKNERPLLDVCVQFYIGYYSNNIINAILVPFRSSSDYNTTYHNSQANRGLYSFYTSVIVVEGSLCDFYF